jgi:predicted AlkP superfamily pyrophosphatase or phosphodiesterase
MKRLNRILIIALCSISASAFAQTAPPLTVIVVIDQLPITLITENMDLFSEEGFKRLDREGVFYTECRYRHGVLETGPGHATIATGCDPKTHGIVANGWRNAEGSDQYCVSCLDEHPVSSNGSIDTSLASSCPVNIMTEGLSDQWRESFSKDAKIWSMSLKDRAAIAMGGKSPNGALWVDRELKFETSTYYGNALPEWCVEYNKSLEQFSGATWSKIAPVAAYARADSDDVSWERGVNAGLSNVLPKTLPVYDTTDTKKLGSTVYGTPFGSEWLYGLAKTCISEELLGKDDIPDLLWISFSSNDACGHIYGPLSQETLDMTLRTDILIGELLKLLDETVGKGNYWFALSADHGVCPPFESPKIPEGIGGRFSFKQMKADLNQELQSEFDAEAHTSGEFVAELGIPDVGFDRNVIKQAQLDLRATATRALDWLREQQGIEDVVLTLSMDDVNAISDSTLRSHVANNYYPGRSSDAYLRPMTYWQSDGSTANHGSCNEYDLHVPMFLMGAPFGSGRSDKLCGPEDLTPSIAVAAGLQWETPRDGVPLLQP